MNIILATPLYPPDTAPVALYVKELAARLKDKHKITIITYAHIPEEIEGVTIVEVKKRNFLPVRLLAFVVKLFQEVRDADFIYAENGPSVELPVVLVSMFTRIPFLLHMGDRPAHKRVKKNIVLRVVESVALKYARKTIWNLPLSRPDILPFGPQPDFTQYELSWSTHLHDLDNAFHS